MTKGEPAHRENNPSSFQEEALRMLSLVTHWARVDDAELGRPKLSGQEAANPLAVPMMLLYVIDEVCRDDEELRQTYCEDEEWAVEQILKHLQVNRTLTQMSSWLVTQSLPTTKDCVSISKNGYASQHYCHFCRLIFWTVVFSKLKLALGRQAFLTEHTLPA